MSHETRVYLDYVLDDIHDRPLPEVIERLQKMQQEHGAEFTRLVIKIIDIGGEGVSAELYGFKPETEIEQKQREHREARLAEAQERQDLIKYDELKRRHPHWFPEPAGDK